MTETVRKEKIEPINETIIQSTANDANSKNEFLFNFMQEVLYQAACEPYFMTPTIELVRFFTFIRSENYFVLLQL